MPVVQIGIVRMRMNQWRMPMRMCVRLLAVPRKVVFMLVVLVMNVPVIMGHRLMHMYMLVPLGEMEPDAHGHERTGAPEKQAWLFREKHQRDTCTQERRS